MGLRDRLGLTESSSTTSAAYASASGQYTAPALHASVSMHEWDQLRLLHFPPPVVSAVRSAITRAWPKGLKHEREYGGSIEFKVHGYPWQGSGSSSMEARAMLLEVFRAVAENGYVVVASTDVSKKLYDKDTVLFRRVEAVERKEWCCLAFSKDDRLRFIGASPRLSSLVIERLGPSWIERHGVIENGVFEIKLDGNPWWADGTKTMRTRELLLTLLDCLDADGWTLATSVSHKVSAAESYSETDTWFCTRPQGWNGVQQGQIPGQSWQNSAPGKEYGTGYGY